MRVMGVSRRKQRGLTLIELIVAFTILMLLTTMAVPLARFKVRREREKELRWALADIRKAIDKYKDATGANLLPAGKMDSDGYPESLQQLVDGVRPNGSPDKKVRFLRKRQTKPPMHGAGLMMKWKDERRTGERGGAAAEKPGRRDRKSTR